MFYILIDTCVWLDIAKDSKQISLVTALERLLEHKKIQLIVPQIVINEFSRNKARIVQDATKSMSSTLRRARELVEVFGKGNTARRAKDELDNIDYLMPSLGDTAVDSVVRIEALFRTAEIIQTTEAFKLGAAQRALDKRAPFHLQKNSMADAILMEIYGDILEKKRAPGTRFAFVTHNVKDFSLPHGDTRHPHQDLAKNFSKIKSVYSINLGDLLKRVDPEVLKELEFEDEFIFEPKSATEILAESEDFATKIWYDRHQQSAAKIAAGTIKVISDAEWTSKEHSTSYKQSIWKGAQKSAAKVERRFGVENLGPWTKFEWGMMNGKLSALRWCLGWDWDNLDT